ncbi:hypothetical protein L596_011788 [Steinernema carpocapsae]|uniref:Exonuclease domain-containing protein n=1 Tax=Steinernema carpocapsae TaxID=34508 RepID=A0A4U5NVZ2_STECR|nr:hypothetical protein L596_011788 [Steinernema carpocapsae]
MSTGTAAAIPKPAKPTAEEKRQQRKQKRLRQKYHEFQLLSGGQLDEPARIGEAQLEAIYNDPKMTKRMRDMKVSKQPGPKIQLRLDKLQGRKVCHRDLADLMHNSLHGLSRKPTWCNFGAKQSIVQNVLLRINCEDDYIVLDGAKSETHKWFGREWFILDSQLCDRISFWEAICSVPVSHMLELQEHFTSNPEIRKKVEEGFGRGDDLKLKLVNTMDQNISFHYPMPNYVDIDGFQIVPTLEKYKKLSPSSPLYAIDCEMCVTEGGLSELTRISVIDEEGRVILDTLVKPARPITNYVTKFSGITKEMMDGVTVTLQDVQKALARLLPPDAIIVGHSLEFDLRTLHLSHPFCIDVSLVYNITGNEFRRTSLRNLCYILFGETIQDSHGHCSVEDAWFAMRLLKLKMEQGAAFGNIMHGWDYNEWMTEKKRDVAAIKTKEEQLNVPLAKKSKVDSAHPIVKPKCKECSHPLGVKCSIAGCRCMQNGALAECVKCASVRKASLEDLDGEAYDYNELLRIEHTNSLRPLAGLLENSKKNILLAPFTPVKKVLGESSTNYTVFDAAAKGCDEYVETVKSQILNHAVCLLEMTTTGTTKQKDLDDAIMSIANKVPTNTLYSVIFVAPKRSIGYFKVK